MPQQQRIRETRSYDGDQNGDEFGYAPYTGQVGYCNTCQNYNDDTVASCEICGDEVGLISVINAQPQPYIDGARKYIGTKATNFSGHYLKPVATHSSEHLRQVVFVPAAQGDALTTELAKGLASKGELYLHGDGRHCHGYTALNRPSQPILHPKSYCLYSLSQGGRLYLVGHGNGGGAIGDHDDKYGAKSLVQLLLRERLPKSPKRPVTIWLFACATGAAVNPGYYPVPFYRKDPFIQRFSQALYASGCSNYYVVGFAGFVGTDADICVDYGLDDDNDAKRVFRLSSSEERVVYKVTGDGADKVRGGDFIQETNFRWLGNPLKWNWKNTQLQVKQKPSD